MPRKGVPPSLPAELLGWTEKPCSALSHRSLGFISDSVITPKQTRNGNTPEPPRTSLGCTCGVVGVVWLAAAGSAWRWLDDGAVGAQEA